MYLSIAVKGMTPLHQMQTTGWNCAQCNV